MLAVKSCCGYLFAAVLPFMVGQLTWMARGAASSPAPAPFSFDVLRQQAAALAGGDYHPEANRLPDYLKKLTYDDYQAIHFRPAASPWQAEKLPFTLQFFHPGFLYQEPVRIHLVENGRVIDFPFSQAAFDYGSLPLPKPLPSDLYFVGLRILHPVNSPGKQDEVASFLGASYFRLLGQGQRYGASARGLAIDTAEPTGEEFPRFTEFWVEKPGPQADSLKFYGMLNSPSAAGAYQFVLRPGNVTVLDVEGFVCLRKDVRKLGFGALTSMFLVGANRTRFIPDFRPEVHDSDGLLVQTSADDWLWRSLVNPEKTFQSSQFPGDNVKGFGLLQRHREFSPVPGSRGSLRVAPQSLGRPASATRPGSTGAD